MSILLPHLQHFYFMLTSNKCLDLLVCYLQLSLKLRLTKARPKRRFSLPVIFTFFIHMAEQRSEL